jgi:hypothetical protein
MQRTGPRKLNLRVDPTDNDETSNNVTPVESLSSIVTVGSVNQTSKRSGTNNEDDECDSEGYKVSEDTEYYVLAHYLETDSKDHCHRQLHR